MIDSEGYRPNVGIIVANGDGRVLWAKRVGQEAWQFPQGGINAKEAPEEALFRELREEIGLKQHEVKVVGATRGWLRYKLPKRLLRNNSDFVGQKQKWGGAMHHLVVPSSPQLVPSMGDARAATACGVAQIYKKTYL